MNENLDLVKILKYCPRGTKLYSPLCGEVVLNSVDEYCIDYPIEVNCDIGQLTFTRDGRLYDELPDSECVLFPSKDQRDWSKFTAPWYKKDKFDPKTLKPFDKIIACLDEQGIWCCELFSFIEENTNLIKCCGAYYKYCVPYNDETKHLVGKVEEAPEYYRYWEE